MDCVTSGAIEGRAAVLSVVECGSVSIMVLSFACFGAEHKNARRPVRWREASTNDQAPSWRDLIFGPEALASFAWEFWPAARCWRRAALNCPKSGQWGCVGISNCAPLIAENSSVSLAPAAIVGGTPAWCSLMPLRQSFFWGVRGASRNCGPPFAATARFATVGNWTARRRQNPVHREPGAVMGTLG